MPFDVAERKGLGHPDTLADLVADTFSRSYSLWCRDRFGAVPNHWVDKVNLVGAAATVGFGAYTIDKPIDCFLFGKVTSAVGSVDVPVVELFEESVNDIFGAALPDPAVVNHLRHKVVNTSGTAVDHDGRFYRPDGADDVRRVLESESVANDTVICVGNSRRGVAAELAVRLERLATSAQFRTTFPAIGTDVKVMVVRDGGELDVTMAVPLRPELTSSFEAYSCVIGDVTSALTVEVSKQLDGLVSGTRLTLRSLAVNTKDVPGRGYVTPFGTSLGKGDCGVVGRGNPYSGAIEPYRGAGCEAPAGKNPVHHVGKIYAAVAAAAAAQIELATGSYAEVTIAARNGDALDSPAFVFVGLEDSAGLQVNHALVEKIASNAARSAGSYPDEFLRTDPLVRFTGEGR